MKSFSQFNIQATTRGFEGEKIKMSRVLNREIAVHHFKIEDSKCFKERGHGKCLQLQITLSNEKHVIFTSGSALIEAIKQIPETEFPFSTTIVKDNERLIFT
jgi:hypothetical protein